MANVKDFFLDPASGNVTLEYDNNVTSKFSLTVVDSLATNGWIETSDGAIHTLSEVQPVVSATATGTVFTGSCLFRGLVVRNFVGSPQTVTVYDALSATGTPIATFTISALGTYFWDGDQVTVGNGRGGRRVNTNGLHVVFTGGTSRVIDVMVETM